MVNLAIVLFGILLALSIVLMSFVYQTRMVMVQAIKERDIQYSEINKHLEKMENRALPCQ